MVTTAQQLPNRTILTENIVSTDAIGLSAPFVGIEAFSSPEVRSSRSSWKLPAGTAQKLQTAIPLALCDLLATCGSFFTIAGVLPLITSVSLNQRDLEQGIALGVVYLIVGTLLGLFPATAVSPVFELKQLVTACVISFLVLLIHQVLVDIDIRAIVAIAASGMLASVAVPLTRAAARRYFSRFDWWGERAIVIGTGIQALAIYRFYARAPQRGLRPLGVVDPHNNPDDDQLTLLDDTTIPYLGTLAELPQLADRTLAHWGIVALGGCKPTEMSTVMRRAAVLPSIVILPSSFSLPSLWASPRECAGVMGIQVRDHLRSPVARFIKRTIDIVGAASGLLLTAPFFLGAVGWVKFASPGTAFYGHQRIGRGGAKFRAWKFRTMVVNADAVLDQHLESDPDLRQEWFRDHKLKNDPRVIPGIGRFLRKWSLDEVPQLWNVLIGEMSLVGPRPIVNAEIVKYSDTYSLYLRVRPGLTGLWQVSGRNDTSYDQRVRLDSYYVSNWSLWIDAYILVRTCRTFVTREGAY